MTLLRELLTARAHELRDAGEQDEAERLEGLLRDAHEAESLALTGDGAPRSTTAERTEAV